MEQILELMKQCSATLGNELQQCRAAGTPHDALTLRTDEWEAETEELIDALFLQLNNELASCQTSVGESKVQRVEVDRVERWRSGMWSRRRERRKKLELMHEEKA